MINIQTPINNLGYGVAGYNIVKELYNRDNSIALYPIGTPGYNDLEIQSSIGNVSKCLLDRPFVKIWHQHDLIQRIGRGKYFGFPIFELNKFDDLETINLEHCDEIMVCSEWAKQIVVKNTSFFDHQVHVVPLGVDTNTFLPQRITNNTNTIFFNCGKWEKRKGHDVIVECFNKAFEPSDNVELWMMCDNPFLNEEKTYSWGALYKRSKLGDKIKLLPRQEYHIDVARIMNMTDVGVFPSRGEGWNLELLEMMACGKHVIATDYSAHTEFCDNDNCLLVDIDNLETAIDGVFFDGKKGMWAEISEDQQDQIIQHMTHTHMLKQEGLLGINDTGVETAKKFTWKNTADKLLEAINER